MIVDLFNSICRIPKIFNLKNKRTRSVILYYSFITLLLVLPIMFGVIFVSEIPFNNYSIGIVNEFAESSDETLSEEFILASQNDNMVSEYRFSFPSGYIKNGKIYCSSTDEYDVTMIRTQIINDRIQTEKFRIIFNPKTDVAIDDDTTTVILYGDGMDNGVSAYEFYYLGNRFVLSYRGFAEDVTFSDLNNTTPNVAIKAFYNASFVTIVNEFSWIICILVYVAFYLMNGLFLLILAALARLLKYKDSNLPRYGEILKILVYCSTIPCIIGIILGIFNAYPIVPVIYNFAVPIIAVIVYFKNKTVIKGEVTSKEANDQRYLM